MTTGHPRHWFEEDGHLSRDAFDTFADSEQAHPLPAPVRTHLAECEACSEHLAELAATVELLRRSPELDPGRSFEIPVPESAQRVVPASQRSIFDRVQAWLLPSLPALRVATMAVFLLFVAVTSAEFWIDGDDTDDSAPITQSAATELSTQAPAEDEDAVEESTLAAGRAAPANAAPADAAAQSQPAPAETQALNEAVSNDSDGSAGEAEIAADEAEEFAPAAMSESDGEASTSLAMAEIESSATPPAPATPEAIASPVPASTDELGASDGGGWNGWRVAQAILLALLVILLLTVFWLRQSKRNRLLR